MCNDVTQILGSWMLGHLPCFYGVVCTKVWEIRAVGMNLALVLIPGGFVALRTSYLPHPLSIQGPTLVPPLPENLSGSPVKRFPPISHRTLISFMAYTKVLIVVLVITIAVMMEDADGDNTDTIYQADTTCREFYMHYLIWSSLHL